MELASNVVPVGLSYKCNTCAVVMKNISEFQKHLSNCQSATTTKPKLNDGDSIYCGVCCVEMPEIRAVKQKLETENHCESDYYWTNFDSLNCLMCYKVFMSNGDLKDHQRRDHFESKFEKRFACVRCINKSNKFVELPNGVNAVQATSKENSFCSICDKFIPARFWSKHVRNHRDRVVYQCGNCRKIRIGSIRVRKNE